MEPTSTASAVLSASPKVLKCTCSHAYQDATYGDGMRVHNPCQAKTVKGRGYRCTVCSKEQ